tara:strand:+ start:405 stop:932 length:528 start_codon:yes stop_codon:yes gene_type:complete
MTSKLKVNLINDSGDNNIITSDGSGNVTLGTSFPSVGKLGQVLSTNKLDTFSTTSTSFTDITNLSVNITPSSTSSKIYVIVFVSAGTGNTSADNKLRVSRGSQSIPPSAATILTRITSSDLNVTNTMSILDSPSTTSQITYKVEAKAETGTFYINRNGAGNNEGYSTITVMEVLP